MTDFPIVAEKTAMLFFDTLNIYLHPEDAEARQRLESLGVIPAMVRMNQACRAAGIAVFYGQADHRPDYRDFAPHVVDRGFGREGAGTPLKTTAPGAVSGSPGAQIIPELAAQPGDYVIQKHRWSTFYQTHLELSLRTAGIDTIMIAGGAIEVGVASTAYAARDRDFNLIILKDACTSMRPAVKDMFMEQVFPIFARVMTVDEAIAQIAAPSKPRA